jgi:hypothetical protein
MMLAIKLPLGRWMARAAFGLVVLAALEVRLADALPALLVGVAAAPCNKSKIILVNKAIL